MDDQWGAANSLACLGLVRCQRGEIRHAASALDEALPLFDLIASPDRIADMLCRVAVLAESCREHGEAIRLFGAAEAMKERIGVVPALPESAVYDRALSEAKRALSPESYQAWWASGRAMEPAAIMEVAKDLIHDAMAGTGLEEPVAAGLTPRELDVLRLMARGKTDREIGEALYISHRTVNGHIARIFDRLDVHSRAEAAAEAVRLGLLESKPAP
jgi:DNA-binding CsgD family transcriptional regulator